MKIGINTISMKASEQAEGAILAEDLGYDSIWLGEHILMPRHQRSRIQPQPYGPQEWMDSFVVLAYLAGRTKRIRLATGILTLAFRTPILAARSIVGVDVLSGGRFDFAVGLGWMQEEFDVAGTDMRTRGARTDEMMDLINRAFQPGDLEFEGKFYKIPKSPFDPKPTQKPRPPFLVGGHHSEAALRRAARWDGWYGIANDVDEFVQCRNRIEAYRREYGRQNAPYEYVMVFVQNHGNGGAPPRAEIEAYRAAGVHRIVVTPWGYDYDNALPRIAEYARQIGLSK